MNPPWQRIGSAGNPVYVRDIPGGTASVSRGEGGKWTGLIVVRVNAGDDAKARAKVDEIVGFLGPLIRMQGYEDDLAETDRLLAECDRGLEYDPEQGERTMSKARELIARHGK